MGLRQLVIDAWSWLNYKPVMAEVGRPASRSFPELAASWLPPDELRRLAAYKVLAGYDNNQAGQLAAASGDETALERRELGDAANLVDTALGYLLGSDQQIAVVGAEHADDEAPEPGATEAAAVQERLRTWAEKELLTFRGQQSPVSCAGFACWSLQPSRRTHRSPSSHEFRWFRRAMREAPARSARASVGVGSPMSTWITMALRPRRRGSRRSASRLGVSVGVQHRADGLDGGAS